MLQFKQDSEDILPVLSDYEGDHYSLSKERIIRRRSSKACDQCRRAKSKCERIGHQPCQNCATLNVECTFLGPSRKRGPAKGYLSDLELKLHQMEALIGTLIACQDPRATSLIADMSKDKLACDILTRVDQSPVGSQRHNRGSGDPSTPKGGSVGRRIASELAASTYEWQDHLAQIINQGGSGLIQSDTTAQPFSPSQYPPGFVIQRSQEGPQHSRSRYDGDPASESGSSGSPRRLKRVDAHTPPEIHPGSSNWGGPTEYRHDTGYADSGRNSPDGSECDEILEGIGQLSLDDGKQIRYHGKASGLHLLGQTERVDRFAEGGIWHFPPARVWPRAEKPIERARTLFADDLGVHLPTQEQQAQLLDVFFIHMNTALPLFVRETFMKAWKVGLEEASPELPGATFVPSRIPTPLLLIIFSIALRLNNGSFASEGMMSTTGDEYLSAAKYMITANPYASSRPATVQSYLLIAFREIGIGAMGQAFIFLGAAIRMAQDLGLHRSVDKFQGIGPVLFPPIELEHRNRVWWGCVVLDKYVSAYMGRPCIIFERDYDTPLPVESVAEATEVWVPLISLPPFSTGPDSFFGYTSVPSHTISCFAASAKLSSLIGQILESLYSVKQAVSSRHTEANRIEGLLERWYLELPQELKLDPTQKQLSYLPPPHIMTLNMQYWNSILLLHRPFIQIKSQHRRESPEATNSPADSETLKIASSKAVDLCNLAARRISAIAEIYRKTFPLSMSSSFLCYYVFSAAVMHVVALTSVPDDVEAVVCLQQAMDTLKGMSKLWPSAERGWDLIRGCRAILRKPEQLKPRHFTRPQVSHESLRSEGRGAQYAQVQNAAPQPRSLTDLSRFRDEGSGINAFKTGTMGSSRLHSASTEHLRPYSQPPIKASPQQPQFPPINWPSGDGINLNNLNRSPFAEPVPSTSQRELTNLQQGGALPHYWTDAFTDTTLLNSNYYGLPPLSQQQGAGPPLHGRQPTSYENVNYPDFGAQY